MEPSFALQPAALFCSDVASPNFSERGVSTSVGSSASAPSNHGALVERIKFVGCSWCGSDFSKSASRSRKEGQVRHDGASTGVAGVVCA